jgi:hypothetical protein
MIMTKMSLRNIIFRSLYKKNSFCAINSVDNFLFVLYIPPRFMCWNFRNYEDFLINFKNYTNISTIDMLSSMMHPTLKIDLWVSFKK